ncbi:hypothetical protein RSOL_530590, partial [Rhizoctonia solani AG-3 Rhs1AP]
MKVLAPPPSSKVESLAPSDSISQTQTSTLDGKPNVSTYSSAQDEYKQLYAKLGLANNAAHKKIMLGELEDEGIFDKAQAAMAEKETMSIGPLEFAKLSSKMKKYLGNPQKREKRRAKPWESRNTWVKKFGMK